MYLLNNIEVSLYKQFYIFIQILKEHYMVSWRIYVWIKNKEAAYKINIEKPWTFELHIYKL